jgi:predicted RNA-binding protein with PIN domain
VTILVVDGNNVIGSVPDGWWRDRPGAVRRLVDRLIRYAATTDADLHAVFDVAQADLPEGEHDGVTIHYATRRGRDAADDRILELLDEGLGDVDVEVVTSDRALADGARARGARVVGAGTLLARLDDAGC